MKCPRGSTCVTLRDVLRARTAVSSELRLRRRRHTSRTPLLPSPPYFTTYPRRARRLCPTTAVARHYDYQFRFRRRCSPCHVNPCHLDTARPPQKLHTSWYYNITYIHSYTHFNTQYDMSCTHTCTRIG